LNRFVRFLEEPEKLIPSAKAAGTDRLSARRKMPAAGRSFMEQYPEKI
jgi:hypothetical protein